VKSYLRRGSVVTLALFGATSMALLSPAHAVAAPPPSPVASEAQAMALPPYSTWIADVTAVTDQAKAYLGTRLPGSGRTAIVLDIDNTALEAAYSPGIENPATKPVLEVAKQAKAAGAAVFFVTARPELIRGLTQHNLQQAGYPNDGISMRGYFDFSPDQTLKTNARIAIEQRGYTIVANIGNHDTDLAGGHAERTFKLPDYNGQLS
jgi:predicted secreted acid phosphatase